jgi:hypothetical protein
MTKYYKFSELSQTAKHVAVMEYLRGWEETHDKGDMSYDDAFSSCIDTNDEIAYDKKGNDLGNFEDLEEVSYPLSKYNDKD